MYDFISVNNNHRLVNSVSAFIDYSLHERAFAFSYEPINSLSLELLWHIWTGTEGQGVQPVLAERRRSILYIYRLMTCTHIQQPDSYVSVIYLWSFDSDRK